MTTTTTDTTATTNLNAYTLRVQAKHAAQETAMLATRFGIELELVGISRETAARAVAKVLGAGAVVRDAGGFYKKWEVTGVDGRVWTAMSDASLVDTTGRGAAEVVSPILRGEADIALVQEIVRGLVAAGATVNTTCGIHVHTDAANMTAKNLAKLSATVVAYEPSIQQALNIHSSRIGYCKSLATNVAEALRGANDSTAAQSAFYRTQGYSASESRVHYSQTRYHGLNLHSVWFRGTVEFRWFNGTTHAGEVRAYIMLALALNVYARTSGKAPVCAPRAADRADWTNFLFRTLGLRGEKCATVRAHLTKHFAGARAVAA